MESLRYLLLPVSGGPDPAARLAARLPGLELAAGLDDLLGRLAARRDPALVVLTFSDEGADAAAMARILAEVRGHLPPYRLLLCDARDDGWALAPEVAALAPVRLAPAGTAALALERALAAADAALRNERREAAPEAATLDRAGRQRMLGALATLERLKLGSFPTAGAGQQRWQLLLFLMDRHLTGRAETLASLSQELSLPLATALSRCEELQAAGWLERRPDPADARRTLLGPSALCLDQMDRFLLEAVRLAEATPAFAGRAE